ncbi:MAG: hypothetical protein COT18_07415 [Elusimicrobia bacterium CG08_land_8_20_14_0_20_59_10]|nr:MAG: hypothetical protein COT18_07415 [Elusimicrobia bacterium CG08_land_8_20_14_0_20_59_10]
MISVLCHRISTRKDGHSLGRIPNQRMIATRPAEVETRQSVGRWEGDLINRARTTVPRAAACLGG